MNLKEYLGGLFDLNRKREAMWPLTFTDLRQRRACGVSIWLCLGREAAMLIISLNGCVCLCVCAGV